MMVKVTENQLSLTACIGSHYYTVAVIEQFCDGPYLLHHAAVGLVAFLCAHLTGYEQELIGDDRKIVPLETFDAVAFRE